MELQLQLHNLAINASTRGVGVSECPFHLDNEMVSNDCCNFYLTWTRRNPQWQLEMQMQMNILLFSRAKRRLSWAI